MLDLDTLPSENTVAMSIPQIDLTPPAPQPDPGTAQAEGVATPPSIPPLAVTLPEVDSQIASDNLQNVNIVHVNPNCHDATKCNPHGEAGEVTYKDDLTQNPVPKPKHAGGRPCTLCANMENYLAITQEYIEQTAGQNGHKPGIPYIEELALKLSAHRETVMEWAKNKADHPKFSDMIKTLEDIQALRLQQRVLGRFNPTGAIFLLKTKHKYIESEKQIIAGDRDEPLEIKVIEDKPREEPSE